MIRILIVDDHQMVREGMKSILALFPEEFELAGEAATGREAIVCCKDAAL